MKCTYPEVCIWYQELFNPTRLVCNKRDGIEIKNIPKEEFANCKPKTYKDIDKIKI